MASTDRHRITSAGQLQIFRFEYWVFEPKVRRRTMGLWGRNRLRKLKTELLIELNESQRTRRRAQNPETFIILYVPILLVSRGLRSFCTRARDLVSRLSQLFGFLLSAGQLPQQKFTSSSGRQNRETVAPSTENCFIVTDYFHIT